MELLSGQLEKSFDQTELHEGMAVKILVVDDSPFQQRVVGQLLNVATGWQVLYASGGEEAISVAEREMPSIILTDLVMPDMSGLELLRLLKAGLPAIPVILMTSYGSEEIAMRALRYGAANYIPKKYLRRDLMETVRNVLRLTDTSRGNRPLMKCIRSRESAFELENDVTLIPPLIRLIEEEVADVGFQDRVSRIRMGIALHEALTNACYHGNLEVSSELRQSDEHAFYDLIEERRVMEPYTSRRIAVRTRVDMHGAEISIRDEGPGFDTARFDGPPSYEGLMEIGGRGLLLIQSFMDDVRFNAEGNQVTMTKRYDSVQEASSPMRKLRKVPLPFNPRPVQIAS